jgi:hypothetical protein
MKPERPFLEQYWHRNSVSISPPRISKWPMWDWNQVSVLRSLTCGSSEIHVVSRANIRHDGLLQVELLDGGYHTGAADTSLVTLRQFSCDAKYLNRNSQVNSKHSQVFLTFRRNEVSLIVHQCNWKAALTNGNALSSWTCTRQHNALHFV